MTRPLEFGKPAPVGWRTQRLKDVARYIDRGVAPEYADGDTGVFAFNQKCVRPDLSIALELGRPVTNGSVFPNSPARLRAGDIVINSTGRGTLGRAGLVRNDPVTSVVADGHVTIVRLRRGNVDPRFVSYVLATDAFYQQANLCLAVGATNQTELNRETLRRMTIDLPPFDEQRRIADYLDAETRRIDELIAEQEHLVALLLERREAELDGWIEHGGRQTALRKVSSPWVDAVPPGWELTPLKRCAQRVMVGIVINPSAYYEAEGVPVLRGLNIRPGRVSSDDLVFMSHRSNELHRKSILQAGDIVVVRTGIAGSASQVPTWAVGGNAVDLLIVRPGARLLPGFLEHVLNSRVAQRQVHYGSVGALQSHFNTAALANVVVPLPPLGEQLRVLEHLRCSLGRYDALIAEVRMQIHHLRERRQTLITTAVTQGLDSLPWTA